mgnify:CR=1 FL=1
MAEVTKERLAEVLEEAMEDVAFAMNDMRSMEERLRDVRARVASVWKMADLGEVPEWELQVVTRKVS